MNELALIGKVLGLSDDDAAAVLDLCLWLDEEDVVAKHGYPRDTPRARNIPERLTEPAFRARLAALAEEEGVAAHILAAIRGD